MYVKVNLKMIFFIVSEGKFISAEVIKLAGSKIHPTTSTDMERTKATQVYFIKIVISKVKIQFICLLKMILLPRRLISKISISRNSNK
jgi:hypothetical protein